MTASLFSTASMAAKAKLQGGIAALLGGYTLRFLFLAPLLLLWRSLFAQNVQADMTLGQTLSYTCMSAILAELLYVQSPASDYAYNGMLINLYRRPSGMFAQLIATTAGGWLPRLALFSLPLALLSPFLGISLVPATLWFFPSLLLSVSLGFAIDFLFACVVLRMENAVWLVYSIRGAVTALFSGAFLPFALMPFGIGDALRLIPFGSLAGAPLGLFVGVEQATAVLPIQLFWNTVLWPLAALFFRASKERMVSHGG